ncbi:MAG: hypothetical protein V2A73_21145 [Pseudomonadota bacterium]
MDVLIELARGPLFRFSLAIALLGLARHLALSVAGLQRARARAGDKSLGLGQAVFRTAARLNPLRYFHGNRWLYSLLSVCFHVGIILVPVFFAGHVRLWQRGLGIGWPALPASIADVLTITTIATAVLLIVGRAASAASRALSGIGDWSLPALIGVELLTGYMLAHPSTSLLAYEPAMLVHALVGDLLLVVTPFSKIAHCALLPLSQMVVEMAWRLVPGAGRDVTKTLGKEGQPI